MLKQKKVLMVTIFLCFLLTAVQVIAAEPLAPVEKETITRGAVLEQYQVPTAKGTANVYVTKINLQDPYLKVDLMYGTDEKLGKNQTVEKMANEAKAIAAVNGGFFDMAGGTPLGPLYQEGEWITTPSGIDGMNSFALTRDNTPVIMPFSFTGAVMAENGEVFPIAAVNKTISMVDKLNVYDGNWNVDNQPGKNLDYYIVAVVEDGRVEEIWENRWPNRIPRDGYLLLGHGKGARFLMENVEERDDLILDLDVEPGDDWEFVLGAHTLLVQDGARVPIARNITGYHARTAVGYSKNNKTLYWIAVECSKGSSGMTLEELADFMIRLGVFHGVNLDGGGSTTLVSRHPGDDFISLVNVPQQGILRNVPDGLGLFSLAPKGKLKDVLVKIPDFILMNEKAQLSLKAVDEYDNPYSLEEGGVSWTAKNELVSVSGTAIRGNKPGIGLVQIVSDQVNKEYQVEIVGRDQVKTIDLGTTALLVNPGDTTSLIPVVYTKNGKSRTVPAELFTWEWIGVPGTYDKNGQVIAGDSPGSGWLVGTYDRFSTMVPVQVGTTKKTIVSFEDNPKLRFTALPEGTKGDFLVSDYDAKEGKYSGELKYDFTEEVNDSDLQIAYGEFGSTGINFSRTAKGISLWVKGDDSGHWLRAEIKDETGKTHYITLADKLNWNGWKEISVDFPAEVQSPTLKRIYLVRSKDLDHPLQGSILLDEVSFQTGEPLLETNDVELKLFANKNLMLVNNEERTIDQGPIIENSRSYIPARFMVEALGGRVFWDGQEKRGRIILGKNMIDLWINDTEHTIVNGTNKP
ncbi:MAG: phosphodiester glycosidase family protein, partial [Desulfitobacteriaceae bacterium]|nr:phosphodiester glycosidase family protein [Desulfitobacteriaceae bacterium]